MTNLTKEGLPLAKLEDLTVSGMWAHYAARRLPGVEETGDFIMERLREAWISGFWTALATEMRLRSESTTRALPLLDRLRAEGEQLLLAFGRGAEFVVATLRELDAQFKKYVERPGDPAEGESINEIYRLYVRRDSIAEADGVRFQCPLCKGRGDYPHPVYIGFEGVATPGTYGYNKDGKPVLWKMSGTSLDDLMLTPSIQIQGGCNWHGFVGSNGVPPGHAQ